MGVESMVPMTAFPDLGFGVGALHRVISASRPARAAARALRGADGASTIFSPCCIFPLLRLDQTRKALLAQLRARCVALTVPAYVAADLVRRECPDAAAALKALDYPPVAAVTVAYPMSAIRQDRLNQANELPGASASFGKCHQEGGLAGGQSQPALLCVLQPVSPRGYAITRRMSESYAG